MSYLKVKNPETVDVRTVYKGQEYTVPAGETKSYPEEAVNHLVDTYGFLTIVSSKEDEPEIQVKPTEEKEVEVETPKKVKK